MSVSKDSPSSKHKKRLLQILSGIRRTKSKSVGEEIPMFTDMDNSDEFSIFEPFVSLPPKSLRDYYQVIPHPVSLKGLQKRVRGIHGRNGPTGISDFKSWRALEEEAEYIWNNAWHYNEDGSEISNLAKDLQVRPPQHFPQKAIAYTIC
jgi:hypothetical protein